MVEYLWQYWRHGKQKNKHDDIMFEGECDSFIRISFLNTSCELSETRKRGVYKRPCFSYIYKQPHLIRFNDY